MSTPASQKADARVTIAKTGDGLLLGGGDADHLPLWGGSVDYAFLGQDPLARTLDGVAELGATVVSTSIPWSLHQPTAGAARFTGRYQRYSLELPTFFRKCADRGLSVIARVGPTSGGEIAGAAIPPWVRNDSRNMARGPRGEKVFGLIPPPLYALPSYAASSFRDALAQWLTQLGAQLLPFCYPDGPLVAITLETQLLHFEGAGAFHQDYHPDAVVAFRSFLQQRYQGGELPAGYGKVPLDQIHPPESYRGAEHERAPVLDWLHHREQLLRATLAEQRAQLEQQGISSIAWLAHCPLAEHAQACSIPQLQLAVDAATPNLRHLEDQRQRADFSLARMRGESALRVPLVPLGNSVFTRPMRHNAQQQLALQSLAGGAAGLLFDSLSYRDRWSGSAFDGAGKRVEEVHSFIAQIFRAYKDHALHRRWASPKAAVLVRRDEQRLASANNLLGPLPPMALQLLGLHGSELFHRGKGASFVDGLRVQLSRCSSTDRLHAVVDDELDGERMASFQRLFEIDGDPPNERSSSQQADEASDEQNGVRWRRLPHSAVSSEEQELMVLENRTAQLQRWDARQALGLSAKVGMWDLFSGLPLQPEAIELTAQSLRFLRIDRTCGAEK